MEYFWYILASVLAGVGTGLVGLSAATVMVPILIVLCPSFAGETGAYQATAIALTSDIVKLPLADPKKTWEGSAAMVLMSAAVGTAAMLLLTAMPWQRCLLYALLASIPGAYTELITPGGNDTVTVPVVNAAVLLTLHFLLDSR